MIVQPLGAPYSGSYEDFITSSCSGLCPSQSYSTSNSVLLDSLRQAGTLGPYCGALFALAAALFQLHAVASAMFASHRRARPSGAAAPCGAAFAASGAGPACCAVAFVLLAAAVGTAQSVFYNLAYAAYSYTTAPSSFFFETFTIQRTMSWGGALGIIAGVLAVVALSCELGARCCCTGRGATPADLAAPPSTTIVSLPPGLNAFPPPQPFHPALVRHWQQQQQQQQQQQGTVVFVSPPPGIAMPPALQSAPPPLQSSPPPPQAREQQQQQQQHPAPPPLPQAQQQALQPAPPPSPQAEQAQQQAPPPPPQQQPLAPTEPPLPQGKLVEQQPPPPLPQAAPAASISNPLNVWKRATNGQVDCAWALLFCTPLAATHAPCNTSPLFFFLRRLFQHGHGGDAVAAPRWRPACPVKGSGNCKMLCNKTSWPAFE